MHSTTHARAIAPAPRYDARFAHHRTPTAFEFRGTFRHARAARAARDISDTHRSRPAGRDTFWPVAFSVLLAANLATPATSALPPSDRRVRHDNNEDYGHGTATMRLGTSAPTSNLTAMPLPDQVIVRPVTRTAIKSDYAMLDVLKAVAAARSPFLNTGESLADVYEIASGQPVAPDFRRMLRALTGTLDTATGIVPDVQALRMPAEIADIAADRIEGRALDTSRLSGVLQFASPRGQAMHDVPEWRDAPVLPDRDAPGPPAFDAAIASDAAPGRLTESRAAPERDRAGYDTAPDSFAEVSGPDIALHDEPASPRFIQGEQRHLSGYAQTLPERWRPKDETARLFVAGGHHYLRGEAGDYRITRGFSDDHWLVDAPRRNQAQVPVTFDPATGRWQAHAPLRLCGGGCGPSRPMTPDSITSGYEDIFAATRHLPDESAQEAIQNAFADVGRLRLLRSNREDLRDLRDNSIVGHRAALSVAMKDINRGASLRKQQRQAAEATAMYYFSRPFAEAFCQENAEVLFYFLLQDGVDQDNLRMITVQPKGRAPHVMVLYSESREFIDILDRSTPQPKAPLREDGVTSSQFAWGAYLARDTTVLLDPWSRYKAISFARADTPQDAVDILDSAFAEIGHRTGYPYTVSVTRPLAARRHAVIRQTSSSTSLGSSASTRSSNSAKPEKGERRWSGASGSTGGSGASGAWGASGASDAFNAFAPSSARHTPHASHVRRSPDAARPLSPVAEASSAG